MRKRFLAADSAAAHTDTSGSTHYCYDWRGNLTRKTVAMARAIRW